MRVVSRTHSEIRHVLVLAPVVLAAGCGPSEDAGRPNCTSCASSAGGGAGDSTGGSGGSTATGGGPGGSTGDGDGGTTPTSLCGTSVNGTYALDADRATVWNTAGMLSKGGIPSASWPVCNETPLAPSGGGDDTAAINDLVQSCPEGTVALLGPGTFLMTQGQLVLIDKGVVLRGAGAGETILENPLNGPATQASQQAYDTTPIIIVGPNRWPGPDGDAHCSGPTAYQPAFMQQLTVDGTKGSSSVTVADASIFHAGQIVLLDETSGAGWQPDVVGISASVWASPDYAVEWTLHDPPSGIDDPIQAGVTPSPANNFAGSGNGQDAACWFGRQDRPQNEIKEIASVDGNTITFASPLHKDYRTSHYAELTTYTGSNAHVANAGVEMLTLVGGGDGALRFQNAAYSWARNVEVATWYGEGVALDGSFRVELRDSYVHNAAWAEPGGAGYALSLAAASSELLIENNISVKANKVMVSRSSGAGSVVGYNYMDHGYIATAEGWIEVGLNASHMVGSHHVLFEGNQSFNIDSDDTHGNSTYLTFFRNWTTSVRSPFKSDFTNATIDDANSGSNGPKRAAGAATYAYWMSFVGNVLGSPSVTTAANGYVDETTDWTSQGAAIWMLGWNGIPPYTTDPNVAATAVRDGNWDALLGTQTWLNGSAAPLPSSCYRSSKPAFFVSSPWPWVEPTTGTVHTLPAKARYDAGTPNTVP